MDNAKAGAGVYFGHNDHRNAARRVPGPRQSNQTGEAYAIALAAEITPTFAPLTIVTDSTYMYNGLTEHLQAWENRGWIGVENKEVLQYTIAKLRKRSAPTWLRWVKGHSGDDGNEGADRLAEQGTRGEPSAEVEWSENEKGFLAKGAKLATMTQKLAYKGILAWGGRVDRHTTERNIEMIKAAMREDYKHDPTTATIWRAIWAKDVGKRAAAFLWKAIHGAYKVGSYWSNIEGYEDRGVCRSCVVEESMEHILLQCSAPGQHEIWEEVRHVLRAGGAPTPRLSLGAVLGAASTTVDALVDEEQNGKTRLTRIVMTEAVHLIWKIRCERVIGWAAEQPTRVHTNAEVAGKWKHVINERLKIDIFRAKYKGARKRLPPETVLSTWKGTLHDERALPENWIKTQGVLVGTLQHIPGPQRRSPTLP
ncbi:hypothetical protein C2E23DRAFT_784043 [Lenzites betulinus]|nr:hypothetical protein C2E23DRAFT_784043 [Lenzites betulinus]